MNSQVAGWRTETGSSQKHRPIDARIVSAHNDGNAHFVGEAGVAERWSALHGVPVQVTTTGTARPLPPDAEVALLRTAQEALANVAKHARAARVG